MKKIILCMFMLSMIFTFTACGKNTDTVNNKNDKTETTVSGSEGTNTVGEENNGKSKDDSQNGTKILVAYFSATGTTKGVAEKLANGLKADSYEITPKEPYTDADLDYSDNNSRSTIEMNDPDARPEIADSVDNMDQYEVVFIGYPIWWGDAPRVVSTFMESYDFSGKTIVPFCTSGGSGIGSSASNLAKLTENANWLEGRRFSGNASKTEISNWILELSL